MRPCSWSLPSDPGTYPTALDHVTSDLQDCMYANCGVTCGGFDCDSYTNGEEQPCDACMVDKCMPECVACQANSACAPYWTCFAWCGEPGEASCGTCTSNFSAGGDEMGDLFSTTGCLYLNCGEECY
jgi:hypothetical protein